MAQLTEKTLAWIEASVGASATGPPAVSGCPFWSSPSPVPAPQAPSTSTKAAIPQRESEEARVAKRALLDHDLSANFALRAVNGGSAGASWVSSSVGAVDVEVGTPRAEIRQVLGSDFRPLRCGRSEEHTSELQSPCNLVCRLLLEKKKQV